MEAKHYLGASLLAAPSQTNAGSDDGGVTEPKSNLFSRRRSASGKENASGSQPRRSEQSVQVNKAADLTSQPSDALGSEFWGDGQATEMRAAPMLPKAAAQLSFLGAARPAPAHPRASPVINGSPAVLAASDASAELQKVAGVSGDAQHCHGATPMLGDAAPVQLPAQSGSSVTVQPATIQSAQGPSAEAADGTTPNPQLGATLLESAAARFMAHQNRLSSQPRPCPATAAAHLSFSSSQAQGLPTQHTAAAWQAASPAAAHAPEVAGAAVERQGQQQLQQQPAAARLQPVTPAVTASVPAAESAVAAAPARKPPVRRQPSKPSKLTKTAKPASRRKGPSSATAQKPGDSAAAAALAGEVQDAGGGQGAAAVMTRRMQRRRLQRMTLDFSSSEFGDSSCSDTEQQLHVAGAGSGDDHSSSESEAAEALQQPKPRRGTGCKRQKAGAKMPPAAPRAPRARKRAAPADAAGMVASAAAGASQPAAKRRAAEPAWTGITASGKPKATTNGKAAPSGQRSNFVRTNMKGGGRFSFKSKSGSSHKRRGGRFGGRGPGFMKQAGEGADFLEGCEGARSQRCFKCGALGHWAAECRGFEADGSEGQAPPPQATARATAAAAARPVSVRPAGDMWAPEGGYEALAANPSEEGLSEVVRNVFGFPSFRGHQLPVVQAVLRGRSTLAIMPTGAGKSLCYQLAAVVGGGTVLVVSPLLALMRDQLAHLPPGLPAAMLSASQPHAEARQILDDLKAGRLRVLLVAPERLHSAAMREALAPLLPLPLVAVDEAHCVAEWGHNFRSAYFRLGHMLRTAVPAKAVLALTATATTATATAIAGVLGIEPDAIIREDSLRTNLRLAVSHHNGGSEGGATRKALLRMLQPGGELAEATSVIVYCTYQAQCAELAGFLCTRGLVAAAYHAGKPMKEREAVQEAFCSGKLRVVVATVAFGMGLDARNVRAVVHASMPRSPEEYVQHVGRAGRDGEAASCHLFLDDADFLRLRSLAHSDGVDAPAIASFLRAVFGDEAAPEEARCRYRVLPAAALAERLDMRQEVLETLLSYLEAEEQPYLHVLSSTGTSVQAAFYSTDMAKLAEQHPGVAALLAAASKPRNGCYKAATADLVAAADAPPHQVMRQLQELAAGQELRFEVSCDTALCFEVLRAPDDVPTLAASLAARTAAAGAAQLARLDAAYRMFAAAATAGPDALQQEAALRSRIAAYFEQAPAGAAAAAGDPGAAGRDSSAGDPAAGTGQLPEGGLAGLPVRGGHSSLALDCRELLAWARRAGQVAGLTARALARVLHGLASPAFPADRWSKCGVWGRYAAVDFAAVHAACQQVLDAKRLQALAA